jgi:hypothetical protein
LSINLLGFCFCWSNWEVSIIFDLVNIFKVTRFAATELHLWIYTHLIGLFSNPLSRLLIWSIIRELLAKNDKTVEVRVTKAINKGLDWDLALSILQAFGLQDSNHLVKSALYGLKAAVADMALHEDKHLLVEGTSFLRAWAIDEIFGDFDGKYITRRARLAKAVIFSMSGLLPLEDFFLLVFGLLFELLASLVLELGRLSPLDSVSKGCKSATSKSGSLTCRLVVLPRGAWFVSLDHKTRVELVLVFRVLDVLFSHVSVLTN